MAYRKMPLAEQLERAYGGYHIHPEHVPCVIRALADTKMDVYMADPARLRELARLMGLAPGLLAEMAVREAAVRISKLRRPGEGVLPHAELLHLFALPVADGYKAWKEAQDAKKENA